MKAMTMKEKEFIRKNGGAKLEVTLTGDNKHYVVRGRIQGSVVSSTISSMLKKGKLRHDTERQCFVPSMLALVEAGIES